MSETRSCLTRALVILRRRHFYFLISLFGICTLLYYFGELVDFTSWEALRWGFFYDIHDVQRLLFLIPIIYAGYIYRIRGAMAVTIAAFIVFLPRALFISPFPDPVLRPVLFTIVAGVIGYLTGMVCNQRDRTAMASSRLQQVTSRIFRILENMEEGVLIIGLDYRIRYMNTSMVKKFGKGLGSHCYEYLCGFASPCDQICQLPKVIDGAAKRWEYNFPDGRTYEMVASPFVDSDGITCQLANFRDITKHKQIELELIELNRLKSEFLSNVSHELRSPLTSIKGIISGFLQKDIEWDDQTREILLAGVSEETDRLASLVTNLLNMSRLEAGGWRPEKESCNIYDIINETLEQQKWTHQKHTFETDLEPRLPEIYVDYNQMRQVLINLLENAVAYSKEGTWIIIGARAVDCKVEVSVSDEGVGIPLEEMGKIFDKFYRGSQTRQSPGGTGLGLTICQAIILAHGGQIWAVSEVGRGSTFYFTLPVVESGK